MMRRQILSRLPKIVFIMSAALLLFGCSDSKTAEVETEPEIVHDMAAGTIDELSYGADQSADWDKALTDNDISKEFSDALSRFSFQTAGAFLHETGENEVLSPVSIYLSLSLLETGSGGETKAELDSLLRMKDADDLSDQCKRLITSLSYVQQRYRAQALAQGVSDYKSGLIVSDSLWISRGLSVKEEYLKNASENFYASTNAVNFENPDSNARIEYWIRDMTNGVIRPRINLPSNTVLALVNTLYYYGAWETPFDEEATVEDIFTLEDGENSVTASYCLRTEPEGEIYVDDGCMISSLKTCNGCEMVIMLPDEEHSVDEYLNVPDRLRSLMEKDLTTKCFLTWKIPKFSFGSSYSLPDTLKTLGVTSMFGSKAEFPGISDEALSVSDILHQAHIAIDENGVEGAAFTLAAMNKASMMADQESYEMICDRPFIFGIREQNTGTWLFLGVCRNPAA